jgi:hypothetical protein
MFLFLICLLFLFACESKEKTPEFISTSQINIIEATRRPVFLSEFFEDLEYIKLETNEKCLFDKRGASVYLTSKYVIITYFKTNSAYLFDRNTGKFIKQIGRRGQGPNEYISLVNAGAFDEKEQILYFDRLTEWIGFHIETDEISIVKKPRILNEKIYNRSISKVANFFKIDSDTYVGYANNFTGSDSIKLVFFNRNGDVQRTEPNHQTYQKAENDPSRIKLSVNCGQFYTLNNSLYFKEAAYNDTIFRITPDSLSTHLTFFTGNKQFQYRFRELKTFSIQDYYIVDLLAEKDAYVFFDYWYKREYYLGFFNKDTGETVICENKDGTSYFVNDFDNIFHFRSAGSNSVGEFYYLIAADYVTSCFQDKKPKSAKLQPLLNTKEDDNPILVIATIP